ncbi:MAG: hypothetical protein ACKV2T_00005, partial [Kofleriaceae bacterium]
MSAQLDQILSYLDKEGVTEIMIGMGQPASLRRRGQLIKLTNTPVTRKQLDILLHGTQLAAFIPDKDGVTPRSDVMVGARMVRVIVSRRGEDIILRLEKSPPGATVTPPPVPLQVKFGGATSAPTSVVPVIPSSQVTQPIDLTLDPDDLPRRARTQSKAIINRARGFSKDSVPAESRTRTPVRSLVESRTKSKPPDVGESRTRSRTKVPKTTAADNVIDLNEPPAPPAYDPPLDHELPQRPASVAAEMTRATPPTGAFAQLLAVAIERGATDLHIASGRVTSIRVLGQLVGIASPTDVGLGIDDARPRSHADVEA